MTEIQTTIRRAELSPFALMQSAYDMIKEQYWLFVGICAVGMLMGSICGFLYGPAMCGIYLCLLRAARQEEVEFGMLFKGFDYFGQALLAWLIMMGLILVLVLPVLALFGGLLVLIEGTGSDGAQLAVMGLTYVGYFGVLVLFSALTMFVFPLIVERQMGAWDAVKVSIAATRANFGAVLGLTGVTTFALLLSAGCCYLPAFLLLPIVTGSYALAYREVFKESSAEVFA